MNKKCLFGIILVLTGIAILILIFLHSNTRYKKFVVDNEKWNSIISRRSMGTSIRLEKIVFNDYELLIDDENNEIYYSVVNSNKKYNPFVKYVANQKVRVVFSDFLSMDKMDQMDSLKVMLYSDKEYRIYSLVMTDYPILNVTYREKVNSKNKVNIELELFDNHVDAPQRVLKSDGRFRIIEEDKEYSFSLKIESLGHNMRDNPISIFGMEKRDEYILQKVENIKGSERYVQLFINNQYIGLFLLDSKEFHSR